MPDGTSNPLECNSPRTVRNPQRVARSIRASYSVTHQGLSAIHNVWLGVSVPAMSVTHQGLSAIHNPIEYHGLSHGKCNSPRTVRNPQLFEIVILLFLECNSPRTVRNPQQKLVIRLRRIQCNSPRTVRNPQLKQNSQNLSASVTHQGLSAIHNSRRGLRVIRLV